MENISLRAYIRKIENQIDNGQIDQAIAHCKHILKIYPKHIDSYRLLGKTLLEKQKYGDASDIFQRVLSSVPDDFISHIGMSMIREDENNLDAAIWHMERAFEVQPSNKAVQDELRRLYTNRDGVAPPKVRLTRGALVRMYTRGELYNQAIAEILSALSEDPNRVDLEVMLARIYFQLDKKVEATETCSKLISKLPYCLEANKILSEILLGTSREEDQRIFRQRVIDLDPYFQFVNEKTLSTADVPDSSIMLEFLDWDPSSVVDDQPDWAQSIGFALDDESTTGEDFSSWIDEIDNKSSKPIDDQNTTESDQPLQPEEDIEVPKLDELQKLIDEPAIPASATGEDDELPDWFKDAGWEVSKEKDESKEKDFTFPATLPLDDPLPSNKDGAEEEEEEILPAEIPSWLKAIAPSGDLINLSMDVNDDDDDDVVDNKNLENLFDSLEKEKTKLAKNETKILWENEFLQDDEASLEETLRGFDFSSMLNDDDESKTSSESEGLKSPDDVEDNLDWIKSLSIEAGKVENEDVEATFSADEMSKLEEDEVIDKQSLDQIINELEDTEIEGAKQESSDVDWLSFLVQDQDKEEAESEIESSDVREEKEIPDWIKSVVDESIEKTPTETSDVSEEKEVPDWIKSVVDESMEQTSIDSPEEIDSLPDWLAISDDNIESKSEDIEASFEEEQTLAAPMANIQGLGEEGDSVGEKVMDESYSELLNDEESFESQIKIKDESALELESSMQTLEDSEAAIDEIQFEADIQDELAIQIDEEIEDDIQPDLEITSLEIEDAEGTTEEDHSAVDIEEDELDSAIAWMEGLASKQGAEEETLMISPEEKDDTIPEWITEESKHFSDLSDETVSTPSWLKELEIETEEVTPQDSEALGEKTPTLDLDSPVDEKSAEFPGEMETDRTQTHDFINLIDQLETEIDSQQPEPFDQDIDKEIHPLVDSSPEAIESGLHEEDEELGLETTFVEEGEEAALETTMVDEVFRTEDQKLDQMEEMPLLSDELVEAAEEDLMSDELVEVAEKDVVSDELIEAAEDGLPSDDQELESVLSEEVEEEVEDTQPIMIKDNRLVELEMANKYLDSGNSEESIELFNRLIEESFELDEIINNIQNALDHHYPIDINLWQALGDAYFKNNQLQNALDAYSKAEDLLL